MEKVKVSIIITVVKNRGWLDECIQSALNQDFEDYEIILASDGNPEMKKYAEKYDIKFSLADKKNLSHNQNIAMRMAKGEFIKGLADDDLLLPNCLKDLTNNIKDNAIIHSNAINFNNKTGEESIYIPRKQKIILKDLWEIKSSFVHGGTTLFRRDVFLDVGGRDEVLNCCEDYEFYLNLLSRDYEFSYVDKVVYRCRKHWRQKSKFANSPNRKRAKRYIYKKYEKFIIRSGS